MLVGLVQELPTAHDAASTPHLALAAQCLPCSTPDPVCGIQPCPPALPLHCQSLALCHTASAAHSWLQETRCPDGLTTPAATKSCTQPNISSQQHAVHATACMYCKCQHFHSNWPQINRHCCEFICPLPARKGEASPPPLAAPAALHRVSHLSQLDVRRSQAGHNVAQLNGTLHLMLFELACTSTHRCMHTSKFSRAQASTICVAAKHL